ncbi:S8 family serine peptidase [Geomesophilobacter sediminis]|uniref:S8 family serine peptidase n=1 Tax=Geomesophilobacter sediminis TaxID=2798584 RepID=A0A8J7IW99_9BACT|nr:S8 family serine peptidase [Geomesophilobacter sediminis]MBJ6723707.1 S8 family serine peptidase [Geomesophilobacter sediminis]
MTFSTRKPNLASLAAATFTLIAIGLGANAASAAPPSAKADYLEDELLVQFVGGVSQADAENVVRGHGATVVEDINAIHVKRIKVPPQALAQIKSALAKNTHVKFVEENFLASGGGVPNDLSYPSQWHLPKISAPTGWDITTGSASVPIAIVDSGVDPTHPDLSSRLITGYNFLNSTTDTHDVLGHGTAVAGTAAATGNNGIGVAGVAWQNPIMPIVVLDANDSASYSNIANGITFAVDHGVRIINVSIGGSSASSTLQNAVNYAWNKGALVFVSAMNNSTSTPYYPAACTNAIAVSSTDQNDNLSSFSNYGSWITLSAPGSYIYTTNNGGGYGAWQGTSFSSPLAAGAAALALSVNPALSNQDVKALLIQNADDLGTPGFDQSFGYGRINLAKTLSAAQTYVPHTDTNAPTVSFGSPLTGASLSGSATVTVSATDDVGVTKVELYSDGNLVGTDTSSPYTYLIDTTQLTNGSHTLEAMGYDAAGNIGTSTITVNVSNGQDLAAPTAWFTSPGNGSSLSGLKSTVVKSSSSDNVGVTRMELYIDGVLKSTSTSNALNYNWNLQKVATGPHTLQIIAYDAAGNQGSTSIAVNR